MPKEKLPKSSEREDMAKASAKVQRDREMKAVKHNKTEQRILEKSLHTLNLEQTYALKLLEINNRVVKVRHKKLRERVTKIKSHLPAEEITKFRELDLQGKLKPSHGEVNFSSAVKIAAASRRLQLNNTKKRTLRSALPRISVCPDEQRISNKSPASNSSGSLVEKVRRSNSVTGAFVDTPQPPDKSQRPISAYHIQNNDILTNKLSEQNRNPSQNQNKDRSSPREDKSRKSNERTDEETNGTSKDLGTQGFITSIKGGLDVPEADSLPISRNVHTIRATSAFPRTRTAFSSHTTAEKDARAGAFSAPPQRFRNRKMSHVSVVSVDSNLGENVLEERRQELLEEEGVRAVSLDKKTKLFLKEIDDYIEKNPPLTTRVVVYENNQPAEAPRKDSFDALLQNDPYGKDRPIRMPRRKIGEAEMTPTSFPESNYKERLIALWKDMNKCRYLRVPDERIDLSGVNTLVKDQMKLFETLRKNESLPLRVAWEN